MFNPRIASVLGSLVLGVTIFACSAPAPATLDNGDDGESAPSASTTKKPTTTTTSPTTPAGNTTTPTTPTTDDGGTTPTTGTAGDGATCKASSGGDEQKCGTCCAGANGEAFKVADDAFDACTCTAGSKCASKCGTFCSSKNPNDISQACGTCMDSDQTCGSQADQACQGDATCAAADTCMATCMGQ